MRLSFEIVIIFIKTSLLCHLDWSLQFLLQLPCNSTEKKRMLCNFSKTHNINHNNIIKIYTIMKIDLVSRYLKPLKNTKIQWKRHRKYFTAASIPVSVGFSPPPTKLFAILFPNFAKKSPLNEFLVPLLTIVSQTKVSKYSVHNGVAPKPKNCQNLISSLNRNLV